MEYIPVRIGTLRANEAVPFSVFIPIADKHVQYIRSKDVIEGDRIANLKEKGIRKLFIQDTDESAYLDYLDSGLNLAKDKTLAIDVRATMVKDSLVTAVENAERALETEAGYKRTENQVGQVIDFIGAEATALKEMVTAAGISIDDQQHAASVSTMALGLAGRLKITDKTHLNDLALAAMLMDISVPKLGMDPTKPAAQFTPDEAEKYRTHPSASCWLLKKKPFVNERILRMVQAHEECGVEEPKGYPNFLVNSDLQLDSHILNLCNAVNRMSMAAQVLPVTIMPRFFNERAPEFDLELMSELHLVLMGKTS